MSRGNCVPVSQLAIVVGLTFAARARARSGEIARRQPIADITQPGHQGSKLLRTRHLSLAHDLPVVSTCSAA